MAVLLETSVGDMVIDLLTDVAPQSCENFLKLCKMKYYNYAPLYNVQKGFSFQTGDPIGPGQPGSDGGSSIWGLLPGPGSKTFNPEFNSKLKHIERGTVSMATVAAANDPDDRLAGSQFIITLGSNLDFLDGKAAIFGKVVEGVEVLDKINEAFVDVKGWPLKDIRIRHTIVLDDPFPDPRGFVEPEKSPVPTPAQLATVRIADDEELTEETDPEALETLRREREAQAQALTLEMVGDLPFAEVKPPENVLFVCKLNPVTEDEDLELIFGRFGKILSCEVIRDKKTGDSLQYSFIEFEERESCEQAYFKMQDVLIDDHRIHVDFSQSVSKLSDDWRHKENDKRRTHGGGGWGGMKDLEKRTQYRGIGAEKGSKADGGKYGMVFRDEKEGRRSERSRSPRKDKYDRNRRDRSRERQGRRRQDDGDRREKDHQRR
jgi:peptidyl-prolyl cis-trans isomerase-like 4